MRRQAVINENVLKQMKNFVQSICSRSCRTITLAGAGVLLLITGVVVKNLRSGAK